MDLIATPWSESEGYCDCCGNRSRAVWGDVSDSAGTVGVYFVHWTENMPEHLPCFDIVLGAWGEGTSPDARVLVSLVYDSGMKGGSFTVVDSKDRPADSRSVCGRALKRNEVIGTPVADDVFAIVDVVWLQDDRIEEIRTFA